MTDFEGRKKRDECWYSPAFYSHVGGYKMCLSIDANGWDSGKGTHVSVCVYMMKGEFDSHLKWSFTGKIITVVLVNQTESTTHDVILTKTLSPCGPTDKIFQRVTDGDKAAIGWGYPKFISHSDLYNPEEGKEYLVNDNLIFRVTNVEVTSV